MKFKTLNTTYEVTSDLEGNLFIQGHPYYCPEETAIKLHTPVQVGESVWFERLNVKSGRGRNVRTSVVQEILSFVKCQNCWKSAAQTVWETLHVCRACAIWLKWLSK